MNKDEERVVRDIKEKVFEEFADYWLFEPKFEDITIVARGHKGFSVAKTLICSNPGITKEQIKRIESQNLLSYSLVRAMTEEEGEELLRQFNVFVKKIIKFVLKHDNDKRKSKYVTEKFNEGKALLALYGVNYKDWEEEKKE